MTIKLLTYLRIPYDYQAEALLFGVVAIVGIVALLFSTSHFVSKSEQLQQAIKLVADLEIRLLNLRRNEKDFLLRSDVKYLSTFDKNVDIFLSTEKQLAAILTSNQLPSSTQLRQDLLTYQKGFQTLVAAYQTLGLNEQQGLLGNYLQELKRAKDASSAEQVLRLMEFNQNVLQGEVKKNSSAA